MIGAIQTISPYKTLLNVLDCGEQLILLLAEKYGRIPDTLRHQICKIVERRLVSRLTENLSFLNHADIFNGSVASVE
jgi:hypothetical protein